MNAHAHVTQQPNKQVEYQVKDVVQVRTKEEAHLKKDAQKEDDRQAKRQIRKEDQGSQLSKEANLCRFKPKEGEPEQNLNKATSKVSALINTGMIKPMGDANANHREGSVMNGAVKHHGKALVCSHQTKLQTLDESTSPDPKANGGSQGLRASVTILPVRHLSPPVIKLEPPDVKRSGCCDEVQPMDVR